MANRRVKFKVVTYWETDLPEDWDDDMCHFWANDGTWCAQNMFKELAEDECDCGCFKTKMEIVT